MIVQLCHSIPVKTREIRSIYLQTINYYGLQTFPLATSKQLQSIIFTKTICNVMHDPKFSTNTLIAQSQVTRIETTNNIKYILFPKYNWINHHIHTWPKQNASKIIYQSNYANCTQIFWKGNSSNKSYV